MPWLVRCWNGTTYESFAELRRIGRPMQQIDIMIGAIAFSLGQCVVVTADADLATVPGLTVENWVATGSSLN
jgi:tRNA(fMet)-specific endonuclease VapC